MVTVGINVLANIAAEALELVSQLGLDITSID
jgi:hypothetical protein